ncbi:MAG: AAA family ATPase, partial [Muribaculaceae bacterium]|nr:AAA family ATPase [Muribaculaceae bacterium]
AVKHFAENGHLFATPSEAVEYASEIPHVSPDKIYAVIDSLTTDNRLVESRGGLYLPVFYEAEKNGAQKLVSLASAPETPVDMKRIPVHDHLGHEYSPVQRRAIRLIMEHPVSVLTGGPGAGKTTVLKGVLDLLSEEGKSFILTAPTGRAAKRMSILTGFESMNIHRLLGYRQGEGSHNKKIDTDVLIIDEGSMMEQVLLDHLLQAVKPNTKIIFVGDVDQLPAIGAGDVMRELIKSGIVPVITLDENFRQNEGSLIAAGAKAINNGEMPDPHAGEELLIMEEKGISAIHDRILALVADELPNKFGISPAEIQVVTPQQMGPLGARQLNIDLQQRLNPAGPEIKRGATILRLGDPVMQTANSRERDLFNGEVGRIIEVDPEEKFLIVEFSDGKRSKYLRSDLSELILAYATTVHKLQGSEVNYMVMPVTMAHRPMLYRNLLYTGVSRARKLCALVGEEEAIRYAVENSRESVRNSNFSQRLIENKKKIDEREAF